MISILYGGNSGAFDGMMISLISLVKHTKEPIDVYILTMDLTDKNPAFAPVCEDQRAFLDKICKEVNGESSVTLIDVGDLYRERLFSSPNAETSYTPYTLLRLLACEISSLPKKILYLDTDTVINKDISELWNTDVENYEFAASLDYYGKIFMGYKYVNAGVLLLNLDMIKKTGLFDRAIDLLNRKKIFLPDQTALNRLVKKKLVLDTKYNEQKHFKDDTVIQHFAKTIIWFPYFHTRNIKPWNVEGVKSLTDKYNDVLELYQIKKQDFEKEIIK
ncbi:MAG: glycosyltransferase family 8 protein [Eubacteriales bacterium]